jgi:hypothetical protein
VPRSQPIPQFVIAGGPTTGRAPLHQRLGPSERAGFVAQNVKVMLEIEHMLAVAVAALQQFSIQVSQIFSTLRLRIQVD